MKVMQVIWKKEAMMNEETEHDKEFIGMWSACFETCEHRFGWRPPPRPAGGRKATRERSFYSNFPTLLKLTYHHDDWQTIHQDISLKSKLFNV
jgi:hypothetical protein